MKKLIVLFCGILITTLTVAQTITEPETFTTAYEQQVLTKTSSTFLELLMAPGEKASAARTESVKQKIDAFVAEVKSSDIMRLPEAKLMKELHKRAHAHFLTDYHYYTEFPEIFETGAYNCVTATALFALVLEELRIPYSIQELPTHVYIMAYPDTKAVSVEMTALKNAYYSPARKDVSKAVRMLVSAGLTTEKEVQEKGEQKVYQSFFNTNDVINLRELAGIQYYNAAIVAINAENVSLAYSNSCKTVRLYESKKTLFFKREILATILDISQFKSLLDFKYLMDYARDEGDYKKNVSYQYSKMLEEELIRKGKREMMDSCQQYMLMSLTDSTLKNELSSIYYAAMSDHYDNAYNLKKRLEYAELAYKCTPDNPAMLRWLSESIIANVIEKYEGLDLMDELDAYLIKYPALRRHNRFLMLYYYACVEVSNEYYSENDGELGKKYFDLAVSTRDAMEDKEVLDEEKIGWLYAEAGSYLYRENRYEEALKILEEGLLLAPGHERLETRIDIVKSRLK